MTIQNIRLLLDQGYRLYTTVQIGNGLDPVTVRLTPTQARQLLNDCGVSEDSEIDCIVWGNEKDKELLI